MFDTASNNKINTKTTQISLSNSNINAKATQINFYLDADRSGCDGKTNMQETCRAFLGCLNTNKQNKKRKLKERDL